MTLMFYSLYIFGGFGPPTKGFLDEHGDFFTDPTTWVSLFRKSLFKTFLASAVL